MDEPMTGKFARVLSWLFVLNLGIAFGAGMYEARVVIPKWASIPPSTWPNTGLMFWVYVTTVPLTLLTLASAVVAWRGQGPGRRWWLGAVAIVVVERMATFTYFIPTMVRLMGAEPPIPQAEAWGDWNRGWFWASGMMICLPP